MRISRIETSFLKSRVARRVFGLFVICALLPLLALAGFTFFFVSGELEEQTAARLVRTCKAKGLEIYEHLLFLETEMLMTAEALREGTARRIDPVPYASDKGSGGRFRRIYLAAGDGAVTPLFGEAGRPPEPGPGERRHMERGGTLVTAGHRSGPPSVRMMRLLRPGDRSSPILTAEVNPLYLWGIGTEGSLPPNVEIMVSDAGGRILLSSLPSVRSGGRLPAGAAEQPPRRSFAFGSEGKDYIAASWELFMEPRFFAKSWTIVLAESEGSFLRPVKGFKAFFFPVVLLTFWVVLLLSVVLIRKSMVPIESLRSATERIAAGELDARVDIRSRDEFEALGRSFNEMGRRLEEGRLLLARSAKMSAFGQMAAGVVHEIGQPLTSLQGLVELTLDGPTDPEQRKYLETVQQELERLRGIVIKFKAFSRAPDGAREEVSLNDLVLEAQRLVEHQLEMKGISCTVETEEAMPPVRGDANSLQQVLVNLLINAMDALEESGKHGRAIEIRTFTQSGRACVSVRDNGPGVPDEIRDRIFDPFFTTKEGGKGTGLGLAIVESIVHQHGGAVRVETDPAPGMTFTVLLPPA